MLLKTSMWTDSILFHSFILYSSIWNITFFFSIMWTPHDLEHQFETSKHTIPPKKTPQLSANKSWISMALHRNLPFQKWSEQENYHLHDLFPPAPRKASNQFCSWPGQPPLIHRSGKPPSHQWKIYQFRSLMKFENFSIGEWYCLHPLFCEGRKTRF